MRNSYDLFKLSELFLHYNFKMTLRYIVWILNKKV